METSKVGDLFILQLVAATPSDRPSPLVPGDVWAVVGPFLGVRDIMRTAMTSRAALVSLCSDTLWRDLLVRDATALEADRTKMIAERYTTGRHFLELYRRRALLRSQYPDGLVMEQDEIIVRFQFVCPLRWEDMEEVAGGDMSHRKCNACGERVEMLTAQGRVTNVMLLEGSSLVGGGCWRVLLLVTLRRSSSFTRHAPTWPKYAI